MDGAGTRLECSDGQLFSMCRETAQGQGRSPREAERELYAGHPQIVLLLI